jgi:ribonuclease T2
MSLRFIYLIININIYSLLIICNSTECQRLSSIRERKANHWNQCSTNYSTDFLLLSLQWPSSYCLQKQLCNKDIAQNQWQIHGLWPQRRGRERPQFCCSDTKFQFSNIEPLLSQLMRKWKSLRIDGNHKSFWRHEWTKHGSCARLLPLINSQFNYFNITLQLYDLFPLNLWLNKRGIKASNDRNYSLNSIHQYIEYELKTKIRLECLSIRDSIPVLSEIHICLNKTTLEPIDCHQKDDKQCGHQFLKFPTFE